MPPPRLGDDEPLLVLGELFGAENDERLLLRDKLVLLFARLPPNDLVLLPVLLGDLLRMLFIRSRLLLADPPRRPLLENAELFFTVLLVDTLPFLGVNVLRGFCSAFFTVPPRIPPKLEALIDGTSFLFVMPEGRLPKLPPLLLGRLVTSGLLPFFLLPNMPV